MNRLNTKDLINIGIFTAITAIIVFTLGIVTGFAPVIHIFMPSIAALTSGVTYMMLLTKVQKTGVIFIMSTILGGLMLLIGSSMTIMVTALLSGIVAEFITKSGGYKSFKHNMISYCVFSFWNTGTLLPFWIMRETSYNSLVATAGVEYAESFAAVTPIWMLPVMYISTIIFGIIGAKIGKRVLHKHFLRAGIA